MRIRIQITSKKVPRYLHIAFRTIATVYTGKEYELDNREVTFQA